METADGGPLRMIDERTGLEAIPRDECLRLLENGAWGRLAVIDGARPNIFPMNYALDGQSIVARTAPGTKLVAAGQGRWAAFEVDAADVLSHSGWSVVATGPLEEVTHTADIERFEKLPLQPWARGERSHWLRLNAIELTGRRLVFVAGS